MITLRTADLPNLPGALCVEIGGAMFFDTEEGDRHNAIATCAMCPARLACLEYALEHHPEGVWAGTTFAQRRRMRRERGAAA